MCAWLLTPLSTLHHAIQTTQLAPFTFSIRAACASSLFTIRAIIEKFEGCGFAAIAPPPIQKNPTYQHNTYLCIMCALHLGGVCTGIKPRSFIYPVTMNAEGEKTCKNTGNVITHVCRGREAILGASKKKRRRRRRVPLLCLLTLHTSSSPLCRWAALKTWSPSSGSNKR